MAMLEAMVSPTNVGTSLHLFAASQHRVDSGFLLIEIAFEFG